jgi:hypothetical protein
MILGVASDFLGANIRVPYKLPDLEYSGLSRTYIVHVRTFSSCTYVRITRLYKLYNITILDGLTPPQGAGRGLAPAIGTDHGY